MDTMRRVWLLPVLTVSVLMLTAQETAPTGFRAVDFRIAREAK
jgi:hypothetical protein